MGGWGGGRSPEVRRAVGTPIETIRAKIRACRHDKREVWRSEWVSPFPNGRGSEPSPRGSCGYRRTAVAGHKRFRGRPSFWGRTPVPRRDDVLVSCTIEAARSFRVGWRGWWGLVRSGRRGVPSGLDPRRVAPDPNPLLASSVYVSCRSFHKTKAASRRNSPTRRPATSTAPTYRIARNAPPAPTRPRPTRSINVPRPAPPRPTVHASDVPTAKIR